MFLKFYSLAFVLDWNRVGWGSCDIYTKQLY